MSSDLIETAHGGRTHPVAGSTPVVERENASNDIDVLCRLIQATHDSIEGYHLAADEAPSRGLRAAFLARVDERQVVIRRLRERLLQLGGRAEENGSILAKAHRLFLCIRDRVDEDAIVAEVDHGESYLSGMWRAALERDDLTPDTLQLINGCYVSIQRGQEEWRRAHQSKSGGASGPSQAFELAGDAVGRS